MGSSACHQLLPAGREHRFLLHTAEDSGSQLRTELHVQRTRRRSLPCRCVSLDSAGVIGAPASGATGAHLLLCHSRVQNLFFCIWMHGLCMHLCKPVLVDLMAVLMSPASVMNEHVWYDDDSGCLSVITDGPGTCTDRLNLSRLRNRTTLVMHTSRMPRTRHAWQR
jgi:hypothetical protein